MPTNSTVSPHSFRFPAAGSAAHWLLDCCHDGYQLNYCNLESLFGQVMIQVESLQELIAGAETRLTTRVAPMKVVLHELLKCADGTIQLLVSFGDEPARTFFATYDGADQKYKFCFVDEELFMRLSDLAHHRFGNCTVYQMEVMGIVAAFVTGEYVPVLPATLGTTRHCKLKPGRIRILWNKLWILLYRIGLYHPRVWLHPDYQSSGRTGK